MKIFLLYIFIVIIQIIHFYVSFEKNKNMKMKKSNSNKKELIDKMGKELNKRVELLKSKKMKYNDWLAYNNTNVIVDIDSNKFNIIVYEDLLNNDNFINRVNVYKQYIGLSWQDIVKATNDQLVFSKYSTDKDLLLNANSISEISKNNQSTILYYWVDPESIIVYKRLGHFLRWTDPVTKISGLIGITYNVENLKDEYKYIHFISNKSVLSVSFATFFISYIIQYIEPKLFNVTLKSYLFLIVSNLSIFYYLNKGEGINSPSTELEKMNNINVNVLSLSFLTGIIIFILNSFKNDNKMELFKETSIQFAISLLFLLNTLMRVTNYETTNDVIKLRVSNQFKFDFAILINTFIILNYCLFLLSKRFKFNY
jgi:hypothetical protein